MLLEKVAKRFLGKVLQPLAGLKAKLVERVPGLAIKFDAAADGLMIYGTAKVILGLRQNQRPSMVLQPASALGFAFGAGGSFGRGLLCRCGFRGFALAGLGLNAAA